MTIQEAKGDHSPEPLTPTSIVNLLENDDGPHTPEDAATQENKKKSKRTSEAAANGGFSQSGSAKLGMTTRKRSTIQQPHDTVWHDSSYHDQLHDVHNTY